MQLPLAVNRLGGVRGVILCAVFVAALPELGLNDYWQRELMLVAISALVVSGLNLSLGYAGELALGQVAMYAVGAYTAGYLSTHGHTDLLVSLLGGAITAALAGLISGLPGLRLGTWSLAMVSFFLILLVPDVVTLLPSVTGGSTGLTGIPQPTLLGQVLTPNGFYIAVVVVTCCWFLLFRSFVRGRHGVALRVLRQSPVLAQSMGMSLVRTKMTAYVLGGIPAGLAGVVYAYLQHFLAATGFGFDLTVAFIAASVIGGAETVFGSIFGAALLQIGPQVSTGFQDYALLVYGVFMLLGAILFGGGVVATGQRLLARVGPRHGAGRITERSTAAGTVTGTRPGVPSALSAHVAGQLLQIRGVSKSFGGVAALSDVSLSAKPGRVTAIIGPNGSGKTTLLNVISGFLTADAGRVTLGDLELGGRPAHRVARGGVARTFQTPLVPDSLTVTEAVAASRFTKPYVGIAASALRLPKYTGVERRDNVVIGNVLEQLGLAELAGERAVDLPLGTRRVLEIARAIASEPALLLLDEPASGLDENEIEAFVAIVQSLRDAGATVVLVEHNFPLVLRLADEIHVLAGGRVMTSGTPEEIAADRGVAESYLGVPPTELLTETASVPAQVPADFASVVRA